MTIISFRLALRVEGDWWVAYFAPNDTMVGAVQLGTIRMSAVQVPERKREFYDLMRETFSDYVEARLGVRPTWPNEPVPAPEHERAGRG
jgi:hypothetical protein